MPFWPQPLLILLFSALSYFQTAVQSLGWEDALEEEMATHSSIHAWEIPWTEEPEGLQSMWWQRVGHIEHNSKSYFVFNIKTVATSISSGPKDFPSLYVFSAMLWALVWLHDSLLYAIRFVHFIKKLFLNHSLETGIPTSTFENSLPFFSIISPNNHQTHIYIFFNQLSFLNWL